MFVNPDMILKLLKDPKSILWSCIFLLTCITFLIFNYYKHVTSDNTLITFLYLISIFSTFYISVSLFSKAIEVYKKKRLESIKIAKAKETELQLDIEVKKSIKTEYEKLSTNDKKYLLNIISKSQRSVEFINIYFLRASLEGMSTTLDQEFYQLNDLVSKYHLCVWVPCYAKYQPLITFQKLDYNKLLKIIFDPYFYTLLVEEGNNKLGFDKL